MREDVDKISKYKTFPKRSYEESQIINTGFCIYREFLIWHLKAWDISYGKHEVIHIKSIFKPNFYELKGSTLLK